MVSAARCSAAEREWFFRRKRAGCLSSPQANEFLPAPKKPFARGKPKAKLQGGVSFGYFSLRQRKVHKKSFKKDRCLMVKIASLRSQ
ncbi:MAG: hypothetical protein ACOZBW_07980 [Thermodesulfobacteriota bacterium]